VVATAVVATGIATVGIVGHCLNSVAIAVDAADP
jgi:hypothetical protein